MVEKKIRIVILKELQKGNRNISHSDFDLNEDDFQIISKNLEKQGLISDVGYFYKPRVDFTDASITLKGEKYLAENSPFMKMYNGLKEIKGWL